MSLERGRYPERIFRGKNFMTPNVLEYGRIKPGLWYELSQGRGLDDEPIFGVTIHDISGKNTAKGLNRLCFSLKEAFEYLESLA